MRPICDNFGIVKAFVRRQMLYNQDPEKSGVEPCTVFAVKSIPSRALLFEIQVHSTGAIFSEVPLHMLCWKEDAPMQEIDGAQLWDCFSYSIYTHRFSHLKGMECMVLMKDKSREFGEYLFTIDWFGNGSWAEIPDEHKVAHVIKLDNGCFTAQPNHRILWAEASTITQPFEIIPDYKVNTFEWACETPSKWATEDSERMFYNSEE